VRNPNFNINIYIYIFLNYFIDWDLDMRSEDGREGMKAKTSSLNGSFFYLNKKKEFNDIFAQRT